MIIIPYDSRFSKDFYNLNVEWLETFFYVEDYDKEVLSNPIKYITSPGGHIFFAVEDGVALGTVALIKRGDHSFELTKMAVSPKARGKQIGQQLMQYCLDFATENEFKRLFLYSHTKLENAIHIYRKYGFQEIALEQPNPYQRSNIKMEFPLSRS